ncbi:MAG: PSD1 and planctomycete cytochrome C domain-containing protein [Planctomycetaceae bacterium]
MNDGLIMKQWARQTTPRGCDAGRAGGRNPGQDPGQECCHGFGGGLAAWGRTGLRPFVCCAAMLAFSAIPCVVAGDDESAGDAFFRAKVEPILRTRCYECHSHAGEINGGLVLDSRSGWQSGGDSGPAVVPGDAAQSLLIKAVRYTLPGLEMPPQGKLPAAEIATLEEWVAKGAADPRQAGPAVVKKTGVDVEAGRSHWAYQPVRDPGPPAGRVRPWPLTDADAFLLAKHDAAGIRPAAEADRHTWLRRVTFALTGLPPTEADIAGFVADRTPQAHERVVDRLLASPAYGERWARHWLDLVGYAEQIGTEGKVFAEHAWRYRDYLVDAFNADKPFDRFVREQIAGDLLPAATPRERRDNLVATGFLVLGDVDINAVDKLKMELDFVDSQVSKVGIAFLGMTLGCVRCHDHKFDAIGQEDYYGLAGMFRSTQSTYKTPFGIWSNVLRVPLPELDEDRAAGERHEAALAEWRREKATLAAEVESFGPDGGDDVARRRDELKKKVTAIEGRIAHGEYFHPGRPQALAVQDVREPADMRLTVRGNPHALGGTMPRGLVRVAMWGPQPRIPERESGRRELAEWIADPRNPLTARVAVNRVWQKLFGEGIVRSVDYFGTQGDTPSHPELLDHLAARFMAEGWSHKRLLRTLALSRAYRLSSAVGPQAEIGTQIEVEPQNKLVWRMNARRLDAESIRDAMLVASGRLALSAGGPGLPLEHPENVTGLPIKEKQDGHPQFTLKKGRESQAFERTLYLPVVRTGTQPDTARLRDIFDFPQPAQITGRRNETSVPTQSLYLLNAGLLRQRGEELAGTLLAAEGTDAERIGRLWLRVLSRPATASERDEALAFLQACRVQASGSESGRESGGEPEAEEARRQQAAADAERRAWAELARGLFGTNEFLLLL